MIQANQVRQFMEAMDQPVRDKPGLPMPEVRELGFGLIKEELGELRTASGFKDLVEVADALTDLLYVVLWNFNAYGFNHEQVETLFNTVHQNNMTKLGPDGKAIYNEDGKVVKPEGYKKVELRPLIEAWVNEVKS